MLQNRGKAAAAAASTTTIITATSSNSSHHHHHHHHDQSAMNDNDKQHQHNNNNKRHHVFSTSRIRRRRKKLNGLAFCLSIIVFVIVWIKHQNQSFLTDDNDEDAAAIRRAKERQQQRREKKKKKIMSSTTTTSSSSILNNRNDPLMRHGTWDISPIVVESYQLVFFSVPKIAATTFKQLFRRISGHTNYKLVTSEGNIPHNPSMNGLTYLCDYSNKKANFMLTSPNWTRAIFVRDPKARLVSAYKDKALQHNGWYIKTRFCGIDKQNPYGKTDERRNREHCQFLKPNNKTITSDIFTFELFLKDFVTKYNDPHWEPQSQRVNSLIWNQSMNFIGRFENLYEDSKQLLMKVGAWDKFGSNGWGTTTTTSNSSTTTTTIVGDAIFESNTAKHKTSSTSSSSSLLLDNLYYNTPEIKKIFYDYYRNDYEHPIMNFTKPIDYPSYVS